MTSSDTFDFTHDGRDFRASIYPDENSGAPWTDECGHGPVRRIRSRDEKRPGEVILGDGPDRRTYGFAYDVQAAQRIALRDGWCFEGADLAVMTKRQIAAEAVQRDIKRLEGWARGDWFYVGVAVQALDDEGEPEGGPYDHAVWGIESDCRDYLREVAQELAGEVLADEARKAHASATVGEC